MSGGADQWIGAYVSVVNGALRVVPKRQGRDRSEPVLIPGVTAVVPRPGRTWEVTTSAGVYQVVRRGCGCGSR